MGDIGVSGVAAAAGHFALAFNGGRRFCAFDCVPEQQHLSAVQLVVLENFLTRFEEPRLSGVLAFVAPPGARIVRLQIVDARAKATAAQVCLRAPALSTRLCGTGSWPRARCAGGGARAATGVRSVRRARAAVGMERRSLRMERAGRA
jgi:hypothetical protein